MVRVAENRVPVGAGIFPGAEWQRILYGPNRNKWDYEPTDEDLLAQIQFSPTNDVTDDMLANTISFRTKPEDIVAKDKIKPLDALGKVIQPFTQMTEQVKTVSEGISSFVGSGKTLADLFKRNDDNRPKRPEQKELTETKGDFASDPLDKIMEGLKADGDSSFTALKESVKANRDRQKEHKTILEKTTKLVADVRNAQKTASETGKTDADTSLTVQRYFGRSGKIDWA